MSRYYYCVDISREYRRLADLESGACQIARENVDFHQVRDRLEVIQSDGFDGLSEGSYDLIICNPPYVGTEDMATLPPEFRKEPTVLASGKDGLSLSDDSRQATDWLASDGIMVLE